MTNNPAHTQCSQCDRPAIGHYGGNPLCLEHMKMLQDMAMRQQEAQAQVQRDLMALLNHAYGMFDYAVGIPGYTPKIEIPESPARLIQQGPMNFNNFNISQSKIGVINTGEVHRIDVAMEKIKTGSTELASALQEFTDAVINANELPDAQRNELLEQVAEVSEQAALPPEKQRAGVVRALLSGIRDTATTTTALAEAWTKLQPLLEATFGL